MIALFLQQELSSTRFGAQIRKLLDDEGLPARLLEEPDLRSSAENLQRRRLLGLHRGYGSDDGYFTGFPTSGVCWEWSGASPSELLEVRYINYSYWLELSGSTRRPADAARRIRAGVEAYGVSNEGFLALAERLAQPSLCLPELILVSAQDEGGLVVLEGHVRLTAYALRPQSLPSELPVLVGRSPAIVEWDLYAVE